MPVARALYGDPCGAVASTGSLITRQSTIIPGVTSFRKQTGS